MPDLYVKLREAAAEGDDEAFKITEPVQVIVPLFLLLAFCLSYVRSLQLSRSAQPPFLPLCVRAFFLSLVPSFLLRDFPATFFLLPRSASKVAEHDALFRIAGGRVDGRGGGRLHFYQALRAISCAVCSSLPTPSLVLIYGTALPGTSTPSGSSSY